MKRALIRLSMDVVTEILLGRGGRAGAKCPMPRVFPALSTEIPGALERERRRVTDFGVPR
jgi:hypothetical protein